MIDFAISTSKKLFLKLLMNGAFLSVLANDIVYDSLLKLICCICMKKHGFTFLSSVPLNICGLRTPSTS